MSKQAKKAIAEAQNQQQQFKSQEIDLQMRFSHLNNEQRQAVGNYLNAYNLAAWLYNEILDEFSRTYIDLAMKYTMETQALANSMKDVSQDFYEVDQLVDHINGK